MSDQLREAAQAALEAVETVLNDAYHRRFPECCGRPQGYECCGDWNEARTPDDNRIMDLLSPVQRQLSETLRAALAERKPEPIAWVPVHPRIGPLWAMTTDAPDPERLPSYPLMPLYAHPPRREWVGLTEPELHEECDWPVCVWTYDDVLSLARQAEAALKRRNA